MNAKVHLPVATLLYRLGRWSFLHKWKVIVAWLLLLAAVGGAAALLMKPMTSEFSIKGTPSIDATYKTMDLFPEVKPCKLALGQRGLQGPRRPEAF